MSTYPKWRVERAGTATSPLPGWFAISPADEGEHFDTWAAAACYAAEQADYDRLMSEATA